MIQRDRPVSAPELTPIGDPHYPIYRIDTYVSGTRMPLAFYLVRDGDAWLVTDTGCVGMMRDLALPAANYVAPGSSVTRAVVCHAHADHYGGNAELHAANPTCRIFAHCDDAAWARDPVFHIKDAYESLGEDYPCPVEVKSWVASLLGPATPIELLEAGDHLELTDGSALRVLHLPGHSPGHIGLWHAESGLLLASDAILGDGQLVDGLVDAIPSYLSVNAYLTSIRTIRRLEPEVLCTAHYPVMRGDEVIAFCDLSERFVWCLDDALRRLLVRQAWTLRNLTSAVMSLIAPRVVPSVAAALSVQAHLNQLKAQGATSWYMHKGVRRWVAL